jgi:DNA polymerase I-like protein with 3'-5' exonuclease and polymerase domains
MSFTIEDNIIPKPKYDYITDPDGFGRAMSEIMKYDIMEIDTEATGLSPFEDKVVLLQIGVGDRAFVFDVRSDTQYSSIDLSMFKDLMINKSKKKLLHNAVFDMKMIKHHAGYYIENIYDTMLMEQLFNLGLNERGAKLSDLVRKYLGLEMPKETATTFSDYGQEYKLYQIEYAASDVSILRLIKDLQEPRMIREGFEGVAELEFNFTKPMCEMELNGITIDTDKWRTIMSYINDERIEVFNKINKELSLHHGQNMLFGVAPINIKSNKQLLKSLRDYGINLDNTNEKTLKKFKSVPVVANLLNYRKKEKMISTYSESLLAKINKYTGRLHTRFRQMVATGRMSSSNPNLQNIPKKQMYRSCFISKPGYKLITADMSSAELRILGNLSGDPVFLECFNKGIDLHSKSASEVFKVAIEEVDKEMRNSCKAISFGLMYGLTKFGLSDRLGITEKKAEELIDNYFGVFTAVKNYLETSARNAVKNGYTETIAGRKRFYNIPPYGHPDRQRIQRAVERQAKNAGIQGANADTIKMAMINVVNRLEESGLDAKLILTVHDEVIVEANENQVPEVSKIVESSIIDGFGKYFKNIPMETDSLVGPTWLKDSCKCGHTEMKLVPDEKYKTKLVCASCERPQE